MKIQLSESYIMKNRMQRDTLSLKHLICLCDKCAPPKYNYSSQVYCWNERASLCFLRGSLTVETALVVPFFLMILLAFFSFFSQYASESRLLVQAAAEARKVGVSMGCLQREDAGDVTIHKTRTNETLWIHPFYQKPYLSISATCRPWIGFTELESKETYVYVTPEGSVYHLYADCTHLNLSIQKVTFMKAKTSKNEYGENYTKCEICKEVFENMVYITYEGNRYHAQRNCSGLKRTIRQVPFGEVENRRCCIRCAVVEEEL